MVGLLLLMGASFYKIKFSSTFFKRWQVSSGQRLLVAKSRLQLVEEIGYALRDPKLNCVQLPGLLSCKRQVTLAAGVGNRLCVA